MDNETLVREALVEAEAAKRKQRSSLRDGRDVIHWSDLDSEMARQVLERLSGGGAGLDE